VLAVRHQGIVHDFVMLNAPQAEAAITPASSTFRAALD
jgi:hypothetical protein